MIIVWGAAVSSGWAKDGTCAKCGEHQHLTRICRPVTTVKYVTSSCWDVATEQYCVPCKGPCGTCGCGCETCPASPAGKDSGACGTASGDCCTCGYEALPATRNRLLKKTCVTPVQVTVWVVEYICTECRHLEECGDACAAEQHPRKSIPVEPRPPRNPFVDDPAADVPPRPEDATETPAPPYVPPPPPLFSPPASARQAKWNVEVRISDR